MRRGCGCGSCRARTDRLFAAIVAPLGDDFGWSAIDYYAGDPDAAVVSVSSVAARIAAACGARPDARTPEDFRVWLDRIIDRATARAIERGE